MSFIFFYYSKIYLIMFSLEKPLGIYLLKQITSDPR